MAAGRSRRHVRGHLVGKVAAGDHVLPLSHGGTQLFHRVSLERVGRAIAAAIERAPEGHWAANVADPRDFIYGGLAALVGDVLEWEWQVEDVDRAGHDHPWDVRHPILADTTRLRMTLGVTEPDPVAATTDHIRWLWEHRGEVATFVGAGQGARSRDIR